MTTDRTDLIMHPVRLRIIEALVGPGHEQLTAGQIGAILSDVPPATLYRHIKRLTDGGLLQVIEERPVRGVTERVYAIAQGALTPTGDPDEVTDEVQWRVFSAYIAGLTAAFRCYLQQPGHNLLADGVGFSVAPMYLTDEELAAVGQRLGEALRGPLTNQPAPGRRRRLLYTAMIPDQPVPPQS